MKYLPSCLLIFGCFGIISAEQITRSCDLGDSECALQLLSSLYGCESLEFTNTTDTVDIPSGTVVPYPSFNTTSVVDYASLTGLSNASPLKLVYDYDRDETLLTIRHSGFKYVGLAEFTFSVDDDFDSQCSGEFEITYYDALTTVVFPQTSQIDLSNRRILIDPFIGQAPTSSLGESFLAAIASDPIVNKGITAARHNRYYWIAEQISVLDELIVDGFLGGYTC